MMGSAEDLQLKEVRWIENALVYPESGQLAKANRFRRICIGAGSYCFVTRFN